eukprot:12254478-Alexandrium_andersonii.AAC.1
MSARQAAPPEEDAPAPPECPSEAPMTVPEIPVRREPACAPSAMVAAVAMAGLSAQPCLCQGEAFERRTHGLLNKVCPGNVQLISGKLASLELGGDLQLEVL